ncbi:hypothetical protein BH10ACI1_BH10ACI1_20000 [soil metagenome]
MAGNDDWYPATRPGQRTMYGNVLAKIDNHKGMLELSADFVTRVKLICSMSIAIYDWLNMLEATVSEAYKWRDQLETGKEGDPVQPSPIFETIAMPGDAFNGYVIEFRKKVGQIKEKDGYTEAIGLDLMIVKSKGAPPNLNAIQPGFRFEARSGFKVRVTGRMQGMKSANFYYRRKGENNYTFVNYLTNTPGELNVAPAAPGVPEVGDIKAIYGENNVEVGLFSDSTEITLS